MSSVTSPWMSTSQMRARAWSSDSPSRTSAAWIWSAIPVPAVPAPNTRSRWSRQDCPVTFMPEKQDSMTIAPVPCMSSLKMRSCFALSTRIRRALEGPKSSKWSSAPGTAPRRSTSAVRSGCHRLAGDAGVAIAEVVGAVEQVLVVGADIQVHSHDAVGVDTRGSGVDGDLADRDVGAVHPPVADPEDLLRVGDHDQVDVVGPRPSDSNEARTSSGRLMDRYTARESRKSWLHCWIASPTVGSYTTARSSSR